MSERLKGMLTTHKKQKIKWKTKKKNPKKRKLDASGVERLRKMDSGFFTKLFCVLF